jgi:CRISPR-associated protein Cmr4
MSNGNAYKTVRFLLMTTDPVHVGTGGSRLGRVDNSIVREPGTRLPKIPGTSLSGAIRQYAAYRNGRRECAGQGKNHHKRKDDRCPVCYTFGTANEAGSGFSGMVSIGDARLAFFPSYSMQGPVWVTCAAVLKECGIDYTGTDVLEDQALFAAGLNGSYLNLGWLMVTKKDALSWPDGSKIPVAVRERVVMVSEKLFSHLVNSGLEVRTSVSIKPETGAAEEKALFTYEAIPRAAYLWMDVVEDDFRRDFPKGFPNDALLKWETPIDVVKTGIDWIAHLGVGGMGTRGFGRLRSQSNWEV